MSQWDMDRASGGALSGPHATQSAGLARFQPAGGRLAAPTLLVLSVSAAAKEVQRDLQPFGFLAVAENGRHEDHPSNEKKAAVAAGAEVLELAEKTSAPGVIRTPDPLVRSQLL